MVCIVIPTLNSETELERLLGQLAGSNARIVVTDGGSRDTTLKVAATHKALIAYGTPGRGGQLARGVRWVADETWMLIIHADSTLPNLYFEALMDHINNHPDKAGYFDLKFDSQRQSARIIEWLVKLRCRWFGLPYGDQGLLISRTLYDAVGGYETIPLFEDVSLVKRIGSCRLVSLKCHIKTNPYRFEKEGYFRRGWKNITLLRRYLRGENPHDIARDYA